MTFNVPMNDPLAVVPPHSSEAAALWPRYLTNWTIWNHVRAVAAISAVVGFTLELRNPFSSAW
jgi:uncharacterized membrane protein